MPHVSRHQPSFELESRLWHLGLERLAAVDEVGRGCLAGCVAAAAVIFPIELDPTVLAGVRDSKQLSRSQREALLPQILKQSLAWGVGTASVEDIEQLNIRKATALAMQRALHQVNPYDYVLVDGLKVPELGDNQEAVIKGDQISLSIAAASIVAKVYRDRWMSQLAVQYPDYGWDTNAGYGTPQHLQALRQVGISPHHRPSFVHL